MNFPLATLIPFSSYKYKYDGRSCTVVGRGPTEFDYRDLASTSDPVFLINDAVSIEKYAASDCFFFAHDWQMLGWLNGAIRSTAVLPVDGKLFQHTTHSAMAHSAGLVFYRWREHNREELLLMSRDQIANEEQLYNHTGTIHSVLHFIWFCGFKRVRFIGCDGITDTSQLAPKFQGADGYDPRLANLSGSRSSATYPAIFQAQQLLTTLFELEAVYVGTPRGRAAE